MVNIDYRVHNYCRRCRLKLSKEKNNCPECGLKVRVMPKRCGAARMKPIYAKIKRI